MSTKLEFIVRSMFEDNGSAKINGFCKLQNVESFYKENNISLPVSLTFVSTKSANRLTKDEIIAIQLEYIKELKSGSISEETKNNFNAIGKEDEKVTFTKNFVYSEAIENRGHGATAAKLVDLMPDSLIEKFNKDTRKDNKSLLSISEIPTIIKLLEKIQEENFVTTK